MVSKPLCRCRCRQLDRLNIFRQVMQGAVRWMNRDVAYSSRINVCAFIRNYVDIRKGCNELFSATFDLLIGGIEERSRNCFSRRWLVCRVQAVKEGLSEWVFEHCEWVVAHKAPHCRLDVQIRLLCTRKSREIELGLRAFNRRVWWQGIVHFLLLCRQLLLELSALLQVFSEVSCIAEQFFAAMLAGVLSLPN